MSCLPSDALSHFEQREQELLALNQEIDHKKAHALAEASSAVREAEASSSSLRRRLEAPDPTDEVMGSGVAVSSSQRPGTASSSSAPPAPRQSSSASGEGGSEALHTTIRFQNARIVALQEELEKTIAELTARDGEVQQLRQELKQQGEDSKRLSKANATAEQSQERLKKQLAVADAKLQDMDRDRAELLKAKDQLEVLQRKNEVELATKEARLNRLTEECDKQKAALKDLSSQDKERAVADRRETDRLTAEVRKLERQRGELVNAFKKQMKLIEVLKRQRAHVEAARVLSFTEEEFIRVLELGEKVGE